jgi:hypothetical protein
MVVRARDTSDTESAAHIRFEKGVCEDPFDPWRSARRGGVIVGRLDLYLGGRQHQ